MKNFSTKVISFSLIAIVICACNTVKRIPNGNYLLTKNEIFENNKKLLDPTAFDQLYQKPNNTVLGLPLGLILYNWANPNPDSTYQAKFKKDPKKYARMAKWLSAKQVNQLGKSFWYHGIHDFLKKIGTAPVIFDETKTEKSLLRLKNYYFNKGYFNIKAHFIIDSTSPKKKRIKYFITTGNPYTIDSIKTTIATPALDSLYRTVKTASFIKSGNLYKTADFENEKNRITTHFRNNGVYHFQPSDISFDIDTINKANKANINLIINNYNYQDQDSTKIAPFKIYKISRINIFTDYTASEPNAKITDSISYNNFNLFSRNKLKYKPYAITNDIFFTKGSVFSDTKTTLTTRYLNNLKIFNYPSIIYEIDKQDPKEQSLLAKIYLTPRKKYSFSQSVDVNHSDIQNIGISFSPSISIRNVFNRAETLEFASRASLGSSKDFANPEGTFFNVSEYGLNLKLSFPRVLMPFGTEKIIPKKMIPSTIISSGFSTQKNIGLNKQNFTGAISYNWIPKKNNTANFDLFNVQFIRNLNPQNYFNVYKSSYTALNTLAQNPDYNINPAYFNAEKNLTIEDGTNRFIDDVLKSKIVVSEKDYVAVNSIEERRTRLTENDFILATHFSFTKTNKRDLSDTNFYLFRAKIESAGSILSLFSHATNLRKDADGKYKIFNLQYSEYLKTEFDFIKLWTFPDKNVFAVRTFFGIAIPFGNATSIPFSRSYYAGGPNDNRAWRPYSLGPGSTGSINDFNEANMKMVLSSEYRFKILGSFNGALFVDAGNIWNVLDDTEEPKAIFTGIKSLESIALGSGFGLRYNLNFFIVRFDLGFKTYNPASDKERRWLKDFNFGNSVLNFGITYPF